MIQRNVGLEAKLIDDLLDLTRVTRGKLEFAREIVDVHAAVGHAVRSCCAPGARVHVDLDLSADQFHVRADRARLEQVFFNILCNGVKFTPEHGRIRVSSRNDLPGHVTVEVMDDGIGIDPSALPRIFNAFEQGDPSVTRQFGGLGLGLAVCKTIVELHGGSIEAHSEGRHRGATFRVRLPLAEPQRSKQTDEPQSVGQASETSLAGGRVLLVEDHQPTAAIMRRLMGRMNYDVRYAEDVASAMRLAREHCFDLIVSDLGLPDGSGLDLMRELRRHLDVPGIAISGYGMEQDIVHSRAAGFVEHLVKPVRFEVLEAAMRRAIADRRERTAAATANRGDPQ
jgi:CheY-like chemotaxis protein